MESDSGCKCRLLDRRGGLELVRSAECFVDVHDAGGEAPADLIEVDQHGPLVSGEALRILESNYRARVRSERAAMELAIETAERRRRRKT